MQKEQIKREFKKIDYELRVNKPDSAPYPPDLVKRRGLLLFAQVHLSNILGAKLKKDKWDERFETEMYNKVMKIYYNWNKMKKDKPKFEMKAKYFSQNNIRKFKKRLILSKV